ncbi:MAG: N-acetylneuraminate synthase [Thermodesulfobacteriota bacterium]
MKKRTFIIAEAGVNHNGSPARAMDLVDAAAAAGADAVKFQTFSAARLATRQAAKAAYQAERTGEGGQYEMLKALELAPEDFVALAGRCRERGIEFMSTPFDEESLALLVGLGVARIKVGSGDATNAPLLLAAARTGLPVVLSTGMCALVEVRQALGVLAFGYLGLENPGRAAFREALLREDGQAALREKVTLLHCTTSYPTPPEAVNLLAMDTLAGTFGLAAGYSDHTEGIVVSVAAAARGAVMVEKHFTLDRSLPGPDHAASLEPGELADLVAAVRLADAALGEPGKAPARAELGNLAVARKSLVAAQPVAPGETLTSRNMTVKRPGSGLSPFLFWELEGRPATRGYEPDELLDLAEAPEEGETP